ncbi:MAG: hypothetical protein DMF64_00305 [Acidobacteria bacterium]|nr:MAG: hypothetical protein DMF64_00305 [Acidobacteriota bacterium]
MMNWSLRVGAIVLCVSLSGSLCAQTPAPKQRKQSPAAVRTAADPLAETRRANAISLINSLADDARGFHDAQLRARVQARAADALWDIDKERAKTLFRRAWDAAEAADREAQRREDAERERQMNEHGSFVMSGSPRVRPEVLRLAAKRDRALGEEFLKNLDEAKKQEADATQTPTPNADAPPATNEATAAETHRLRLARELLETGDAERAKQFALPALNRVTVPALQFLSALRTSVPMDADSLYSNLLARAVSDPASDANTVSLLSSYLFTPGLFITVDHGGGWSSQSDRAPASSTEMPADVRTSFFNVAAQVLLRPLPPPDQDHTTSGRVGTYVIIARLLPLFEQYAADKAPLLRTQLAALTPDAPDNWRTGREAMLTEGLRSANEPARDAVQDALDRLPQAKNSDERDQIYVVAAFAAQRKNDLPRAHDLAEKISDADLRRQLRAYLDFVAVMRAADKKDANELLRLAADGELTHIQRVFAYTQAARILLKTDRARALDALDNAGKEAQRIDGTDPDRARAMLAVLTQTYEFDHTRVWEQLPELVKTANALDDFTGEDGRLIGQFRGKGFVSINSTTSDSFDLTGIFTQLAREDMNRAVEIARTFNGEAPRATATLAIARAVLDRKQ